MRAEQTKPTAHCDSSPAMRVVLAYMGRRNSNVLQYRESILTSVLLIHMAQMF